MVRVYLVQGTSHHRMLVVGFQAKSLSKRASQRRRQHAFYSTEVVFSEAQAASLGVQGASTKIGDAGCHGSCSPTSD